MEKQFIGWNLSSKRRRKALESVLLDNAKIKELEIISIKDTFLFVVTIALCKDNSKFNGMIYVDNIS